MSGKEEMRSKSKQMLLQQIGMYQLRFIYLLHLFPPQDLVDNSGTCDFRNDIRYDSHTQSSVAEHRSGGYPGVCIISYLCTYCICFLP